ncbi:MAG: vitamin K epoxide reductase family protein [Anaerolineales bacterium]|uniref:vitamin K epoxide reductase family protein n=1 Tax=Promineifilum sp. TaxID=2664178 RepID=UPI001DAB9ACD|nr:vitamin K epoxide reductase family protein [Anaerolineales bacterium]MCB8935033.1 vitamin K epoxide reductase family protein [Promineifilum sp.]MCO5180999.1 vitamin K epoxide reductase family protein [Promineifilum sp.]
MDVEKWQVRLVQLLAVPGLLVAFYLLLYHNGSLTTTCTSGRWEDCGLVSGPNAPYASIGPIPVALIGLVGYAVIFLLTWLADWLPSLENYLPELLIGIIGLALVFTGGLTALEIFVIHAACRYCLISAAIILVMFLLAASYLREVNRAPGEQGDASEAGTG